MVLTELMLRAIHADRVRDIERAARDRRLVEAGRESQLGTDRPAEIRLASPDVARRRRTGATVRAQAGTRFGDA